MFSLTQKEKYPSAVEVESTESKEALLAALAQLEAEISEQELTIHDEDQKLEDQKVRLFAYSERKCAEEAQLHSADSGDAQDCSQQRQADGAPGEVSSKEAAVSCRQMIVTKKFNAGRVAVGVCIRTSRCSSTSPAVATDRSSPVEECPALPARTGGSCS